MTRQLKIVLIFVVTAIVIGLFSLRALHRRVVRTEPAQSVEDQERRAVVAPPVSTPTDIEASAQMFWVSTTQPNRLAPATLTLRLSADPVERAKQLIDALIANPPTAAQRTLPQGATLLDFYILNNGTAIADFSDELSTEMPSGILSEWLAVSSIAQTLGANVPSIARVKILIHGHEAETLAGHVDLSDYFDTHPPTTPALPVTSPK
ncbi:MAG TPA: GerMN domain-containing protein [Candidatus Acidoferrales bacterium]|nr:GerMN domain-containing protein [Candidatus Acidoferrales bacterium]